MADNYYVSDGNGGKEIPIPVKIDPFKDILKKAETPRSPEKPKDEPVAGDATVGKYEASFAGKEESVVETPKEVVYGHCNNCRLELTEDKVVKNAIDYQRNHDGSLSKAASRFSVFCKNCMKFITLIDNDAAKMLQDMIKKTSR
jgi:hypothetical protein